MVTERVPVLFSDHETKALLPKSTDSRCTIASTDDELEPNDKKCPTGARRGGQEGIPYLFESRLSSRTGRATLVGSRSPNGCHLSKVGRVSPHSLRPTAALTFM